MALVRAAHDVYGVVEVPEAYLDRWPGEYKPTKPTETPGPVMFDDMTVDQLKALLESRGLPTDGRKADLIARLGE